MVCSLGDATPYAPETQYNTVLDRFPGTKVGKIGLLMLVGDYEKVTKIALNYAFVTNSNTECRLLVAE